MGEEVLDEGLWHAKILPFLQTANLPICKQSQVQRSSKVEKCFPFVQRLREEVSETVSQFAQENFGEALSDAAELLTLGQSSILDVDEHLPFLCVADQALPGAKSDEPGHRNDDDLDPSFAVNDDLDDNDLDSKFAINDLGTSSNFATPQKDEDGQGGGSRKIEIDTSGEALSGHRPSCLHMRRSIQVRRFAGDVVDVPIQHAITIAQVATEYSRITGQNPHEICLLLGTDVLPGEKTLRGLGLPIDDELMAVTWPATVVAALHCNTLHVCVFPDSDDAGPKSPSRQLELHGHDGGDDDDDDGTVCVAAFSLDKALLATGSEDGVVQIWHSVRGDCLKVLLGHKGPVQSLAFSADYRIATGAVDGKVIIWMATTGERLGTMHVSSTSTITFAFSPVGAAARVSFATGSARTVELWALATPSSDIQRVNALTHPALGPTQRCTQVAFNPIGSLLASACSDGITAFLTLWSVELGTIHANCELVDSYVETHALAFSPDEKILAAAQDCTSVQLFTVADGLPLMSFGGSPDGFTMMIEFSPDSSRLTVLPQDQDVTVWEVATGECVAILVVPLCGDNLAL